MQGAPKQYFTGGDSFEAERDLFFFFLYFLPFPDFSNFNSSVKTDTVALLARYDM